VPILIAQNLTSQEVHLGDLYTKVPKLPAVLTTFRSSAELMRSPALHKAIAHGEVAIAIQFTQDEIDSEFDIFPGLSLDEILYGPNLIVKNHGVVLTTTPHSIDFTGSLFATGGDNVTVTGTGSGGGGSTTIVADTTGVAANRLCYLSAAPAAVMTDAADFLSSVAVGVFSGNTGELVTTGEVTLEFSTSSTTPVPGKLVFAERADAEALNAAAGKVRIAPVLTQGFVVPVGVVTDVAADYVTSRLASVLVALPAVRLTRVGG